MHTPVITVPAGTACFIKQGQESTDPRRAALWPGSGIIVSGRVKRDSTGFCAMAEGLLQGQRAAGKHLSRDGMCCESVMSVRWRAWLSWVGGEIPNYGNHIPIETGQNNMHGLILANAS